MTVIPNIGELPSWAEIADSSLTFTPVADRAAQLIHWDHRSPTDRTAQAAQLELGRPS
jgi:hypothetical protein